jgi:hypothetical protein
VSCRGVRTCALALLLGGCQAIHQYGPNALTLPSRRLALGAGGGVAVPDARPFGMLEVTGSPLVIGPHLSAGGTFSSQHQYLYGEASIFFGIVVGAGAGVELEASEAAVHAYVGVPVNVITGLVASDWMAPALNGEPLWYGEIYYRPIRGWDSETTIHEIGFFVKRAWGGALEPR